MSWEEGRSQLFHSIIAVDLRKLEVDRTEEEGEEQGRMKGRRE